ncbi:MAG: hypothetical protein KDE09_04475 [Anaerolineales bacterium]|nr:hypothetical protein [Anaerolineales bacterium]MCB0012369.1 hypothetical protein [Anaerolineales bacterium]MCB0017022.1 hypothetical protein [Anaerolineales bacterium]
MMSYIEFETWIVKDGHEEAHQQMLRDWFRFIRTHHPELFAEWKSARYYREISKEGEPTGKYIMLFEFHSKEAHHAYKARRQEYAGPYAAYKEVDPYHHHFVQDSVTTDYWEPQEEDLWLES